MIALFPVDKYQSKYRRWVSGWMFLAGASVVSEIYKSQWSTTLL